MYEHTISRQVFLKNVLLTTRSLLRSFAAAENGGGNYRNQFLPTMSSAMAPLYTFRTWKNLPRKETGTTTRNSVLRAEMRVRATHIRHELAISFTPPELAPRLSELLLIVL